MTMEISTANVTTLLLLACIFFVSCKSQPAPIAQLPCSYRSRVMFHNEELVVDECATCFCDNSTVKCDIQSCPPTFCDEPITDPNECCDHCGYYVPVWKLSPQIHENGENNLVVDLNVKINNKGQTVEGEGLWKVGVWKSAHSDGSGERHGYVQQALSEEQAATPLYRPPIFGGFELSINRIDYATDVTDATCDKTPFLCMEFGKGDVPHLSSVHFPYLPLELVGVESETINSPNPGHLITCTPLQKCRAHTSCEVSGQKIHHQEKMVLDVCTTCSCDNTEVTCDIKKCPPTSCDEPISDPTKCCDFCPDYMLDVPVYKIKIPSTFDFIRENVQKRFTFSMKVKINRNGQAVEGEGLWKVGMWASANQDGSGERIGYSDQVLSKSQSSMDLRKPKRSGGFGFTIPGITYTLDSTDATCSQMKYICAEFGEGDELQPPHLYVVGVMSKRNNSPNPDNLRTCSPVETCIGPNTRLPCSYRGQELSHGEELIIDECTTCYCDDNVVKCDIKSCAPTFCDIPITDPNECCDLCPYYVPVWKISPQIQGPIFENVTKDLEVDLNVKINEKGQGVEGEGLWTVGMWRSALNNGSGERIGYIEQVLTEEQSAKRLVRPPIFGGFEFSISDIKYAINTTDAICGQTPTYLCVEFGMGDAPDPVYPQLAFNITGVESAYDDSPNADHLFSCTPLPKCADPDDALSCDYRGRAILHNEALTIDECTTCTCYNGKVKCDIESCAPTFCDEPITDPNECCDHCPYYVPVWKLSPQIRGPIHQNSVNDLMVNLNVKINEKGQGVQGEGLWKVSVWSSAYNNGSGERIDFVEQVLTDEQSAKQLVRPPFFGGFEFGIRGIKYAINATDAICDQTPTYLCVEFGMGDAPNLIHSQIPFNIVGVKSVQDNSPNLNRLTTCTPLPRCT